ncbi:MAG: hypothetical protein GX383_01460 [Clostridium sp.]|jgi:DNA repair photolyase|nr:hypothetical protein [Clostridium sp.]
MDNKRGLIYEACSCKNNYIGVAQTGSMSDPYNPFEKEYGYTQLLLFD